MNYETYTQLFEEILHSEKPQAPYDDVDFHHYVELNQKRADRWNKKGELLEETKQLLDKVSNKQTWVLIAEPWCGDAAHAVPFVAKMAAYNPNISLEIQLRDSDSEIDKYLTNGGKSIPIVVVRDADNQDLFVWGPRPNPAQSIHLNNLNAAKTPEEKKVELQQWYNKDKGETIQREFISELKKFL